VLTLESISYRYPGASGDALHAISLELAPGRITGLVGPVEGGKSTLCLAVGGLAPRVVGGRLVGDVHIDGEDVRGWPMHRMSEVVVTGLQDPAGQLSMVADTVIEEVAFGPANLGLSRDEVVGRSMAALDAVGVGDLAERDPRRLSGGQQQLVVMAGLLAMRPRYLVLDEPVAHLDAMSGRLVAAAVRAAAEAGAGVLLAEKRTDALTDLCDDVAVIAAGSIVHHGTPSEVLDDPAVLALGVAQPSELRVERLLADAGVEP
jgi:energy-coupling factor transport system ATP-binding protein